MTRPTRVAVIGAGHMGRHHARIYHELPQAELVAVVDASAAAAEAVAAPFGARALTRIDELPDGVEAVSVAVPTVAHVAVAEPLLRRRIAVLVEKPLAASVGEAEQLVRTARECGAVLSVGHTERFNPVVRALQRLNVRPRFIETSRISPFSFRSADIGVVADMMIHDIDIVLHLMRSPWTHIEAVGVNVLVPQEDVANAWVQFESGAVANLTASRLALKTERKIRVFSEQAYLSLDYQKKTGIAITKSANVDILEMSRQGRFSDLSEMKGLDFGKLVKVEPLVVDDVEPLRAELEAFLKSVVTGGPPAVTGEEGLSAIRLAHEIVAAIRRHAWESPAAR
ncbi:MAG: Gfo/Idh/MocA family oxidoreductase [Phycisphaerae bacterium]|nr:Gfo/Idh/MocA family oxidoreductase [Phycisphaerae bacterium]